MEGTLCLGGTLGTSSCHPPWGHLGDVDHGPHATSLGSFWWHLGDTLRTSLWGHRVITPLVAPWGHLEDIIVPPPPWGHLGNNHGCRTITPLVAPWGHFGDILGTLWDVEGTSCLGGTLGTSWGHHHGGIIVPSPPWWHLGDIIVPSPPWGHLGGTLGTLWRHPGDNVRCGRDVVPWWHLGDNHGCRATPPWGHFGGTLRRPWDVEGTSCLGGTLGTC